jgi:site-specific recombinase XerD
MRSQAGSNDTGGPIIPTQNGTVPPKRLPYASLRPREYLTPAEVDLLMQTARRSGRYGHRNATMILLAYRHGLRVAELCSLRWAQVDLRQGFLHVRRIKQGVPSVHPLRGPEMRALHRLQREMSPSPYVFTTERGGPMTTAGFRKMLARIGAMSALTFPVHPHMLRHACGYKLANEGRDTRAIQLYLGHRQIQHTVRYTLLTADRFTQFWADEG